MPVLLILHDSTVPLPIPRWPVPPASAKLTRLQARPVFGRNMMAAKSNSAAGQEEAASSALPAAKAGRYVARRVADRAAAGFRPDRRSSASRISATSRSSRSSRSPIPRPGGPIAWRSAARRSAKTSARVPTSPSIRSAPANTSNSCWPSWRGARGQRPPWRWAIGRRFPRSICNTARSGKSCFGRARNVPRRFRPSPADSSTPKTA